jgi:cytochrome P450
MAEQTAAPAESVLPCLWRHAQVTEALQHPQLVPPGSSGPAAAAAAAQSVVREALRVALAPAHRLRWQQALERRVRELIDELPADRPIDLVQGLAYPCGRALAQAVTGLPDASVGAAVALAERLYLAAACSRDGDVQAEAHRAAVALAQLLQAGVPGQGGLADVQSFVALSQTLPGLCAGAWRVLLDQPEVVLDMAASPDGVMPWLDELLRLGSPARVVYRQAWVDLHVGGLHLRRGERLALDLWAANRDPRAFVSPRRLLAGRTPGVQLGLGNGSHACAGASVVRMALATVTQALVERLERSSWTPAAPSGARWHGGRAMRSPAAVGLHLSGSDLHSPGAVDQPS